MSDSPFGKREQVARKRQHHEQNDRDTQRGTEIARVSERDRVRPGEARSHSHSFKYKNNSKIFKM